VGVPVGVGLGVPVAVAVPVGVADAGGLGDGVAVPVTVAVGLALGVALLVAVVVAGLPVADATTGACRHPIRSNRPTNNHKRINRHYSPPPYSREAVMRSYN